MRRRDVDAWVATRSSNGAVTMATAPLANLYGAGGVAQLAERYVRNVEAEGSSPFTSTGSLFRGENFTS